MYRYRNYTEQLDKELDELRARCMGQYTPLASLVPRGEELPFERLSERVADVLTLILPRASGDLAEKELTAAWRWLRAAAVLLLQTCPEEDHIPYNILKLTKLDRDVLEIVGRGKIPSEQADDLQHPPACMENLPAVIWLLIEPKLPQLKFLIP